MKNEAKNYLDRVIEKTFRLSFSTSEKANYLIDRLHPDEIRCSLEQHKYGPSDIANCQRGIRSFITAKIGDEFSVTSLKELNDNDRVEFLHSMQDWYDGERTESGLSDLGVDDKNSISNIDLGKDILKTIRDTNLDNTKKINKIKESLYTLHEDNKDMFLEKLDELKKANKEDGATIAKALGILDGKIQTADSALDYYLKANNDFLTLLYKKCKANNVEEKEEEEEEEEDYDDEEYDDEEYDDDYEEEDEDEDEELDDEDDEDDFDKNPDLEDDDEEDDETNDDIAEWQK